MVFFYPYGVAFIISILLVLFSTPLVKTIGLNRGYFDHPGERKIHDKPIVRLGGIAICLATLTSCLIVGLFSDFTSLPSAKILEFWGVIVGSFLFFIIGLTDDFFDLSPLTRLILQLGVASLVWIVGVRIEFLPIPGFGLIPLGILSLPITVIWLAGVVNAINWMDGLDGLAAGISGISASILLVICLSIHQPTAALIAAALMASTIGFLRYNFHPAQIFMGDGGSYFIGFTLASLAVIGLMKTPDFSLVILPFLVLAVPILDMCIVILARLSDGRSPFYADRRHLHHRLLNRGLSQRLTVLFIYSLTLGVASWAMVIIGVTGGIFYGLGASGLMLYMSQYLGKKNN
ncbi:MraY family glycosyltransferase [Limnoraphis robusta Tam1]|uniref:glycosyltransferase family 4 protein n=1 Tax=Limnoraphis robusta TaxID=1118279 RepID=UPI002B1F0844|nr:MraY family glycosyltransferase [Limnoraphis robusta]MEA5542571.1 MraY family glycosyltransferase [Limnoraphis robusta Tam1]